MGDDKGIEDALIDHTDQLLRDVVFRSAADQSSFHRASLGVWGIVRYMPARFVGMDPYLLRRAGRRERLTTDALALTLLLTVTLAGIYGYVSWSYYRYGSVANSLPSIVAGIVLASFIYIVERALLEMLSRDFKFSSSEADLEKNGLGDRSSPSRSFAKLAFALASRLAIAILIASIVSEPLLLVIYEKDIDRVLSARRKTEFASEVDRVTETFKPRIAQELAAKGVKDSDSLTKARIDLTSLQARETALPSLISGADAETQRENGLADCEKNGDAGPACQALRRPGDEELSGLPTCDALCRGHLKLATTLAGQADDLRKERSGSPAAVDAKKAEIALLQNDQTSKQANQLGVLLSDGTTVSSDEVARRDCQIALLQIRYLQESATDAHLLALLAYCKTEPLKVGRFFVPYSGLQARQDAFDVVQRCADPNGLRYNRADNSEPLFCSRASGVDSGKEDATVAFPRPAGFWRRMVQPITSLFDVPASTLGQSAARLRWLILVLDTLPLFLKFSLTLRKKRPYDALASLDKDGVLAPTHLAVAQMAGASPDEQVRLAKRIQSLLSMSGRHLADLVRRPTKEGRSARRRRGNSRDDGGHSNKGRPMPASSDTSFDPLGETTLRDLPPIEAEPPSEPPEAGDTDD